jgi:peptidoglycan/LPS O-acetylase OafA/YrhL
MRRIPQLDGLRGVAVLMVFLYHALNAPLMWAGVDLFFVLSGYLITGILMRLKEERATKGYWGTFYLRRLRRIAPPYIGFMIALTILFGISWKGIWYWYTFFGANIAIILGKCPVHAMTPLWSLAAEEQFYFVWPCVVLWCSRRTLKKVAIGIMIGAPVLRAIFTLVVSDRGPIYVLTPFRADLLACGALVAICTSENPEWITQHRKLAIGGMVASALLLSGLSAFHSFRLNANSEFFNILAYSLIVAIFGGALIWALSMTQGIEYKAFTFGPLRYLGQISYTFYLYQVAIMDKISPHLHSRLTIAALTFALTGLFSAASWTILEAPILKLRMGFRNAGNARPEILPETLPDT